MNERIRELAGKALDQAVPETWSTLTAYDLNKFTEKFVELIIRECITLVKSHAEDRPQIINDIEKYFGINNE